MSNSVHIIMYHYVRDLPRTRYPEIRGLLTSQFVGQLDYLTANGFAFVSSERVFEAAHGGEALPDKSVLLTFDDGYIDHYTNVFPILHRRGIPAFFSMPGKILEERQLLDVNRIHFLLASKPAGEIIPLLYARLDHYRGGEFDIPPNEQLYSRLAVPGRFDDGDTIFIKRLLQVELDERLRGLIAKELFAEYVSDSEESFVGELYMSPEQVRLMADCGMAWGIHGYDHYWMNRLSPQALAEDIDRALSVFDGVVPNRNWVCCYPYGSVSGEVIACVRGKGAYGGMTTQVRRAELETDDPFCLPRWDTNDFPPKSNKYKEAREI